ncbi:E3 ubiquitin-protein ligase RNF4, partial [Corvus brachyrhynchos]
RKRRGEADDFGQAQKRSRLLASSTGEASEPEPADLEESGTLSFELETVMMGHHQETQDHHQEAVMMGHHQETWDHHQETVMVALLANDDDEELRDNDGYVTDKVSLQSLISDSHVLSGSVLSSAWPAATIRCPICMDFYPQIMRSGRMVLSTLCGHIFCSQCLPVALQTGSFCPTCREDLTPEEYHPIYI